MNVELLPWYKAVLRKTSCSSGFLVEFSLTLSVCSPKPTPSLTDRIFAKAAEHGNPNRESSLPCKDSSAVIALSTVSNSTNAIFKCLKVLEDKTLPYCEHRDANNVLVKFIGWLKLLLPYSPGVCKGNTLDIHNVLVGSKNPVWFDAGILILVETQLIRLDRRHRQPLVSTAPVVAFVAH